MYIVNHILCLDLIKLKKLKTETGLLKKMGIAGHFYILVVTIDDQKDQKSGKVKKINITFCRS